MDGALDRNNSVATILDHEHWSQRPSGIKAIMSELAFVPHDLNAIGLHALRVVLCSRIAEHLRAPPTMSDDALLNTSYHYERLVEDGISIIPNIERIASNKGGLTGRYGTMLDELITSVSGYKKSNVNAQLGTVRMKDYVHVKVS